MRTNERTSLFQAAGLALLAGCLVLCASSDAAAQSSNTRAFVGARIIDGTGKAAFEKATVLVRDGRIEAVGLSVKIPAGIEQIDASGKTIIPGLINAHGHVNDLSQLGLYARFGVTAVFSLGGDRDIEFRDQTRREQQTAALTRARLYIAGPIPVSRTPEDARKAVDALAAARTDIVKIRVDDNLGTGTAMSPEVYAAIIEAAHKKGMRVAVHIVTLADAKAVLRLGADVIAHSVRNQAIDDETIALLPGSALSSRLTLLIILCIIHLIINSFKQEAPMNTPVHEQILETANRIAGGRSDWAFTPDEIVRALAHVNENTVRTHICSRCCVNAPKNHKHRWGYFHRLRRGVYQVMPQYRREASRAATRSSPGTSPTSDSTGGTPTRRRVRDTIHAVIQRDDSVYVAECLELAVVTQGRTLDELVENLQQAVVLHLEGENMEELGLADRPRLQLVYEVPVAP